MAMEQRQRRRPLTRQEQLALQERKQRRREKMEESRELARGPIDVTFCLLVLLLTAIGLVMLLSASFPSAYYEEKPSHHDPLYYFERQAVFAVLETAVMFLVSKFNYHRLRRPVGTGTGQKPPEVPVFAGGAQRFHLFYCL